MLDRFFAPSKTIKHLNIYVDAIWFNSIYQFHDTNDQSMLEIVEAFDMGEVTINSGLHVSGLQAIFYLKDLTDIEVKLITKDEIGDVPCNKGYLLTKCAIESILKKLYEKGCVEKDAIGFQAREGHAAGGNYDVMPGFPLPIILNPDSNLEELRLCMREDTISHTYAYLSENRMCIFFNRLDKEQESKIKNVLLSLFREQADCLPAIEGSSRMLGAK